MQDARESKSKSKGKLGEGKGKGPAPGGTGSCQLPASWLGLAAGWALG